MKHQKEIQNAEHRPWSIYWPSVIIIHHSLSHRLSMIRTCHHMRWIMNQPWTNREPIVDQPWTKQERIFNQSMTNHEPVMSHEPIMKPNYKPMFSPIFEWTTKVEPIMNHPNVGHYAIINQSSSVFNHYHQPLSWTNLQPNHEPTMLFHTLAHDAAGGAHGPPPPFDTGSNRPGASTDGVM